MNFVEIFTLHATDNLRCFQLQRGVTGNLSLALPHPKKGSHLYHFKKFKEQHLALTFNNHMGRNPPKRKEGYETQSHVAFDWRTMYAAVAKYPMQEKASRLHQSSECGAFIIKDAQILAVIGVGPAVLHCQASAHKCIFCIYVCCPAQICLGAFPSALYVFSFAFYDNVCVCLDVFQYFSLAE